MFDPVQITEAQIRSLSSAQSFERGRQYYRDGAIYNPARQGNTLLGQCEGESAPSYRLQVVLGVGGVESAACTCPYDWGGLCKHLIALLLTFIHEPQTFIERKPVADLLAGLDHEALTGLIVRLVERDPDLYDWLETAAQTKRTAPGPSADYGPTASEPQPRSPIDDQSFRRRIRKILSGQGQPSWPDQYWDLDDMLAELEEVRDSAETVLAAGDARGALIILRALIAELLDQEEIFYDSDARLSAFLDDLGLPLAEAILSADLNPNERNKMAEELEEAWEELSEFGMDRLGVALAALEYGWSVPARLWLGDESQEEDDELGEEEDLYSQFEPELIDARLNVLERQDRVDEYLELCQQAGEYQRYALKLLDLGRGEEAIHVAMNHLAASGDVLSVAQRLGQRGSLLAAISLGEHGLSLQEGSRFELGSWLGPLEEAQGRVQQALDAYLAAFSARPSLELYTALKRVAGEQWPKLSGQVSDILQTFNDSSLLASVYLSEGEWDAAIRLAERGAYNHPLVENVAETLIPHRPDWVITTCRQQAEALIEKTQSKNYPYAANWLERMKRASIQAGRQEEWAAYLDGLKRAYARRPALQAELRRL